MIYVSRSLTAAMVAAGVLLAVPAKPVQAQAVEWVVVDIKVVARGYRASKLIKVRRAAGAFPPARPLNLQEAV